MSKKNQLSRLLIGSGKLAKHLSFYFNCLGLSYTTWNRKQPIQELLEKSKTVDQIWILINDTNIDAFIQEYLLNKTNAQLIHCSGALNSSYAIDLHPLMTFSNELYSEPVYKNMCFVSAHPQAQTYMSDFPNSVRTISPEQKARYHSICVLSGNFTSLLWREAEQMYNQLGLSRTDWIPYLQRITDNLIADSQNAATGPIVRKDNKTIEANLQALTDTKVAPIYESFVKAFYPEFFKNRGAQ